MKFTMVETNGFINAVINSIEVLMLENGVNEIDLANTPFRENGNWKSIFLNNDNKLMVRRLPSQYIKCEWDHDFDHVCSIDILNLQKFAYDTLSKMFSFDADNPDKYDAA